MPGIAGLIKKNSQLACMFERSFRAEAAQLTNDKMLIESHWLEIRIHYSTPTRYYHNLSHLDNLLDELLPARDLIADWTSIVFSIAYHDIIYDPLENNNEEESAKLAGKRLSELSLPPVQIEKCYSQIMATKDHAPSADMDTNFFTDADLAILGSSENVYQEYCQAIRKEYRSYPDDIYKPGRKKVLMDFLAMPGIYKTDFFRDKYEVRAKKNISDELAVLNRLG